MKNISLIILATLAMTLKVYAQGVAISGAAMPVNYAMLEKSITTDDVYTPHNTETQRDTIALLIRVLKILPELMADQEMSNDSTYHFKMTPDFIETLDEQRQIAKRLQKEIELQTKLNEQQQSEIENIKAILGLTAEE